MVRDKYTLSLKAACDLDEIFDYVAGNNVSAAARVIKQLHVSFASLSSQPEMGDRRDEIEPGLRRFTPGHPASSYVIFYRVSPDGIEIARVLHGARDAPASFE